MNKRSSADRGRFSCCRVTVYEEGVLRLHDPSSPLNLNRFADAR